MGTSHGTLLPVREVWGEPQEGPTQVGPHAGTVQGQYRGRAVRRSYARLRCAAASGDAAHGWYTVTSGDRRLICDRKYAGGAVRGARPIGQPHSARPARRAGNAARQRARPGAQLATVPSGASRRHACKKFWSAGSNAAMRRRARRHPLLSAYTSAYMQRRTRCTWHAAPRPGAPTQDQQPLRRCSSACA